MSPQREPQEAIPAERDGWERERLAKDRRGVLGRLRAWRDDPGTRRSIGALSGGVGGPATVGEGLAGESAFRSGAGNREQGGSSLPQRHGRVGGTGAGGGTDGRAQAETLRCETSLQQQPTTPAIFGPANLQNEITRWIRKGYQVTTAGETAAQLVKPKRLSCLVVYVARCSGPVISIYLVSASYDSVWIFPIRVFSGDCSVLS